MSPISQEHYRLFQPLTGSFHDSVQQAHGLKESRVDCGSDWHTRFVLRVTEGFMMETWGPNLGRVAYHIDGRSCYLTNSPLSAPFLKFNLICKPSIQVIFKTVVWGHKHSHAPPSRLFINMRYVNKVFYNLCPCRYYLLAEKELVGLKVQEIRVICAVCPGKMTKFHPSCACWLKALFHIHVYSN